MIRRFTLDDAVKCKEIVKACFDKSVSLAGLIKSFNLNEAVSGLIKKLIQFKSRLDYKVNRHLLFVYEKAGEVLGMIGLKDNLLKRLYVDPDYQRNGVGRELLAYAEQQAVNNGFKELVLYSYENSLRFYRRNGYEVIKPHAYTTKMRKIIT
ncbi:GNAT family N-acetyltransferase [archaeon]|nr:GNAT family N-acetyltransferase [archaeon]